MALPVTLAELAGRPIWVGWKHETRNGRLTKMPYDPISGRRAASDDANTWAARSQAEYWAIKERGDGVGVMLCPVDDAFLCGVDLDSCRDENTGDVATWAARDRHRFATYTEVSPSGTGAKCFFTIASADLPAVEALFDGKHGRAFKNGHGGEHPPAIEIYRGKRYFTVTGDGCGSTDELRTVSLADLQWLIYEAGPRFASNGKANSGALGRTRAAAPKHSARGRRSKPEVLPMTPCARCCSRTRMPTLPHGPRPRASPTRERELRRIFDKMPCAAGIIDPRAPYDCESVGAAWRA